MLENAGKHIYSEAKKQIVSNLINIPKNTKATHEELKKTIADFYDEDLAIDIFEDVDAWKCPEQY